MYPLLMRDIYNENSVRIFSYVSTAAFKDVVDAKNPSFINMQEIRLTLTFKIGKYSFKITQSNKPRVDRFFDVVNSWFRDPSMKDLFIYNAMDKLEFNQKYSALKRVVYSGTDSHQFMEARPTVVTNTSGNDVEGVLISIESSNNMSALTIDEFDTITDIIKGFNFQSEILLGYFRFLKLPQDVFNGTPINNKPRSYQSNNPFK